ncbi:hypothetical protein GWC95_13045 [Sediminibacterium roseum]|uniref:PH domain-containing protein n=1 Tax=Sediminibacterium roseum TaxID=1978412 RepID=A0ABX0A0B1_9BACT|nr:hypothetical protein [Sediminibacterium roseum]NCI50858.1 hypothetical protein [Sediminibacterium roseum]
MSEQSFSERQPLRFKGMWFLYMLFFGLFFLFAAGVVQQVILHKQFGDKPAPGWLLVACSVVMTGMILSFFVARLETKITHEFVAYRWFPFRKKFTLIDWNDVARADVFDFGFIGAGYRFTPHGTVHTAGSTVGLRLKMQSGKTLILGTRKSDELERFIAGR